MRPMQLLGTYLLETDNSTETWKRLLNVTADTTLRPVGIAPFSHLVFNRRAQPAPDEADGLPHGE